MAIVAQCGSCQRKFKADDKYAGKKVKCPQCGGVFTIAAAEPAPVAESTPTLKSPSPFQSSMASLLDEEDIPVQTTPKPTVEPSQPARSCPGCGGPLSETAILCVRCGFDTRCGHKLSLDMSGNSDSPDGTSAAGKKKRKKDSGELSQGAAFLRGCAMSLGFALVGAAMWWVMFYLTDREFGIIAWVLGGMAGAGMAMGYGHEDMLSGLAAAAMAFLGIWAANAMMVATIFVNPERLIDVDLDEAAVEQPFADPDAAGFDAEQQADAETLADGAEAEGEMAEEEFADGQPADEADLEEEMPAGARTAVLGITVVVVSFIMCFAGFFKIICLILALSSAYRIGSNGGFGS